MRILGHFFLRGKLMVMTTMPLSGAEGGTEEAGEDWRRTDGRGRTDGVQAHLHGWMAGEQTYKKT